MQPWLRDQGSGGSRYEDITLEADIKKQLESDKKKSEKNNGPRRNFEGQGLSGL